MIVGTLPIVLLRTALLGAFRVLVSPARPLLLRLLRLILVPFVAFRALCSLHSFDLLRIVLLLCHARPLSAQLLVCALHVGMERGNLLLLRSGFVLHLKLLGLCAEVLLSSIVGSLLGASLVPLLAGSHEAAPSQTTQLVTLLVHVGRLPGKCVEDLELLLELLLGRLELRRIQVIGSNHLLGRQLLQLALVR